MNLGLKGSPRGCLFVSAVYSVMGNGRSIAVGQTAEGVSLSVVRLPEMHCLISYSTED